jgi:hypothetical protein
MSNNVIQFPKENKNIQKMISIDEINHNVEQMNLYHIQETISSIIPMIFTQLEIAGFYPTDEDLETDIRDGAFFVESLRSMLCKQYEIYHPFQKLADNVFEDDTSEEGALKIVDELVIDMREEKSEE